MATYPVTAGDLAVCVAINNNDRAWYEMLVPFILSLRKTDYPGHIAVIGYGLSQQKIDILHEHCINVVVSAEKNLAVSRYSEVARICELNPGLRKVALYDADIWFCREAFDLFDAIEGDRIFACRDPLFCTFITGSLIGPRREENVRLVADTVTHQFGGALQAGLLAGTAQAWRDFGEHVRDCVERIGVDFIDAYGLDTTILHLWAARSRVTLLSETQNLVPKRGVGETRADSGVPLLSCTSGPIRGLHMTSDIRFLNCWRFLSIHRDHALTSGLPFALEPDTLAPRTAIPADLALAFGELGFEVASVATEDRTTLHTFRNADGLHIIGTGNHVIELTALQTIERLVVNVMYISGAPAPVRSRFRLNDAEVVIARDASQWIAMQVPAHSSGKLIAESLPGQMCTVVWILSSEMYLWQ